MASNDQLKPVLTAGPVNTVTDRLFCYPCKTGFKPLVYCTKLHQITPVINDQLTLGRTWTFEQACECLYWSHAKS